MELAAKESVHRGAAPLGQPLEHLVPPDLCITMNFQLGAIGKVDPGFLGTVAMEQEVKGSTGRMGDGPVVLAEGGVD